MKVLVVGKGGREHALTWKIAQSPRVEKIFAAPGSPGIGKFAECIDYRVDTTINELEKLRTEIDRLRDFALEEQIDLTVVGPEDALTAGIVDHFQARGLRIFGPTAAAARIESSKSFSKELMVRIGVPTASHQTFDDTSKALAYVRNQEIPVVVKANGLASGKGAVVARSLEEAEASIAEMMDGGKFGSAGDEVVIEEFMEGEEASVFAVADGTNFVSLVPAQDHKAIFEGDRGPNTGGMGAYAPAPIVDQAAVAEIEGSIIRPVLDELARLGSPFCGVLFCGVMFTKSGIKVVEFNCRFGDPEAQVVLPLLQTDLVELLEAACDGDISSVCTENSNRAAVCVVLASGGYPETYATGMEIRGVDAVEGVPDVFLFHAGTKVEGGRLLTGGGRVLGVTAVDQTIETAVDQAYEQVDKLDFEGLYCRRDIAYRALRRPST
jgi:phosphoribosylamine--glycine ligase